MNLSANHHIVIVGAGHAGHAIATELRNLEYPGRISLLGKERYAPYMRPPLSKAFLLEPLLPENLSITPQDRLQVAGIDFRGSAQVHEIDLLQKLIRLTTGETLRFDGLALATGAINRSLQLPGGQARNVLALRTVDDALALRCYMKQGARLVIVGGGFIGLEVAAAAVKHGLSVTVLETQSHVLSRVTVPEVSRFFETFHRNNGVDIRTQVQIAALEGEEVVTAVILSDAERLPADLVLVGIGATADTRLAEAAGIEVNNGVVVDELARTSAEGVVAAGDCTSQVINVSGQRMRLESIQNANDQARSAAATLLGLERPHNAVPWFWSDQGTLKFQSAGLNLGHDSTVLRGNLDSGAFSLFYFQQDRLLAVDSINRPSDHLQARRWLTQSTALDRKRLADESIKLSEAAI